MNEKPGAMQITAEIPVCLSPSGGHRHSLNSILREPLTIRIGNSSELFGRTITKSKDLRKLQQNLFYKLPECFVNNQIQRNNSRFFHCIVSFIIVNMSDIRDTRENGSPVKRKSRTHRKHSSPDHSSELSTLGQRR